MMTIAARPRTLKLNPKPRMILIIQPSLLYTLDPRTQNLKRQVPASQIVACNSAGVEDQVSALLDSQIFALGLG